jgi:hypothetical protein
MKSLQAKQDLSIKNSVDEKLPSCTDAAELKKDFDSRKRNILERVFAVDKDVRHGRLLKHLTKEKLSSIVEEDTAVERQEAVESTENVGIDGPLGLVIEGAALERLLGDSELEEISSSLSPTLVALSLLAELVLLRKLNWFSPLDVTSSLSLLLLPSVWRS